MFNFIMRNYSRFAFVALSGLAVIAAPHAAAEASGFYAAAYVGYDDPSEVEVDAGPILDELSLEQDISFGIAVGRPVWESIRIEAEFMTRSSDADALAAINLGDLEGSLDLQTFMLNALIDFPLSQGAVAPYLGLGVGTANVDFDNIGNGFLRISGDDDVFAFQGIAGIAIPISEQLSFSVDARYLRTDEVAYTISAGGLLQSESEVETLGLTAGIRFRF
jgi:opacity protein-like surface antigen